MWAVLISARTILGLRSLGKNQMGSQAEISKTKVQSRGLLAVKTTLDSFLENSSAIGFQLAGH